MQEIVDLFVEHSISMYQNGDARPFSDIMGDLVCVYSSMTEEEKRDLEWALFDTRLKKVTPENIQYPNDFDHSNGVRLGDEEVHRYVVEMVKDHVKNTNNGERYPWQKMSTGDLNILISEDEIGFEVEIYRNPETCFIYNEDLID